jgi:hypothetical protein
MFATFVGVLLVHPFINASMIVAGYTLAVGVVAILGFRLSETGVLAGKDGKG